MPPAPEKRRAEFTIDNELGLHFRVAALIVRTLEGFSSEFIGTLTREGRI